MESKFNTFSIIKLNYDRLRTSSREVEFEITEKASVTVRFTKNENFQARINVEVNITPTPITDDSKSMIVLGTDSYYEFYEKPQKEDIDPCVLDAINRTRRALSDITKAIKINPLELNELTITDFKQM